MHSITLFSVVDLYNNGLFIYCCSLMTDMYVYSITLFSVHWSDKFQYLCWRLYLIRCLRFKSISAIRNFHRQFFSSFFSSMAWLILLYDLRSKVWMIKQYVLGFAEPSPTSPATSFSIKSGPRYNKSAWVVWNNNYKADWFNMVWSVFKVEPLTGSWNRPKLGSLGWVLI